MDYAKRLTTIEEKMGHAVSDLNRVESLYRECTIDMMQTNLDLLKVIVGFCELCERYGIAEKEIARINEELDGHKNLRSKIRDDLIERYGLTPDKDTISEVEYEIFHNSDFGDYEYKDGSYYVPSVPTQTVLIMEGILGTSLLDEENRTRLNQDLENGYKHPLDTSEPVHGGRRWPVSDEDRIHELCYEHEQKLKELNDLYEIHRIVSSSVKAGTWYL